MNKQHTPGPWAIYVNAPSDIVIRKMSKDGYELCAIARVSSGYANARLIATAPELLEALEKCRKELSAWMRCYCEDAATQEAISQASAAIAKATGEKA